MDPILTALNSGATKTLGKQNIGKSLQVDVPQTGSGARFYDVMAEKQTAQAKAALDPSFDLMNFDPVSVPAQDLELGGSLTSADVEGRQVGTDKNAVEHIFSELNGQMHRMDRMSEIAMSGVKLDQKDLISMQVFMSESVLAMELATRMVSTTGQGAMSLLQMQV